MPAQDRPVAEDASAKRLLLEDARRNGRYLRATWHPDGSQFVVSAWHDDVCAGAVRLTPADAARLVGHLATGLASAVPDVASRPAAPRRRTLRQRLLGLLRRTTADPGPEVAAPIVDLPRRHSA